MTGQPTENYTNKDMNMMLWSTRGNLYRSQGHAPIQLKVEHYIFIGTNNARSINNNNDYYHHYMY